MFLIMKHAGKDSDINVCVCIYIFLRPICLEKTTNWTSEHASTELENREIE